MPYAIKTLAGKPFDRCGVRWLVWFKKEHCTKCALLRRDDSCAILYKAITAFCEVADSSSTTSENPPEWTHDDAGRPTCTAFEESKEKESGR